MAGVEPVVAGGGPIRGIDPQRAVTTDRYGGAKSYFLGEERVPPREEARRVPRNLAGNWGRGSLGNTSDC
jgi:hypothetical protein